MNFKENLICLRKKYGWSQEELGNELSVARQTISKWELGETAPDMNKLMELADLFAVSVDQLLGNVPLRNSSKVAMHPLHYEYVSKRTIGKLPLVHINIGLGNYKAKAVFALGNIASGIFSLGLLSMGVFAFGCLGLGFLTVAGLSFGLLLALGGIAVGSVAIGGLALGIFAIGGFAVGIYSIGGLAIAKNIAMGGYATGHIAIGDSPHGVFTFVTKQGEALFDWAQVKQTIATEFPRIWSWIVTVFTQFH